jgi:hypothetical protein
MTRFETSRYYILQVDDPATAELLAMLGISASVPSEVAIDCAPVELRI